MPDREKGCERKNEVAPRKKGRKGTVKPTNAAISQAEKKMGIVLRSEESGHISVRYLLNGPY